MTVGVQGADNPVACWEFVFHQKCLLTSLFSVIFVIFARYILVILVRSCERSTFLFPYNSSPIYILVILIHSLTVSKNRSAGRPCCRAIADDRHDIAGTKTRVHSSRCRELSRQSTLPRYLYFIIMIPPYKATRTVPFGYFLDSPIRYILVVSNNYHVGRRRWRRGTESERKGARAQLGGLASFSLVGGRRGVV